MAPSIVVLPAVGTETQIVAGDVGVTIQIPADVVQSFTGASPITVAIVGPTGIRHTVTAAPSGDGTNCTFLTAATDFPVPGTYTLQAEAVFSSPAESLYTSEFTLTVGARL